MQARRRWDTHSVLCHHLYEEHFKIFSLQCSWVTWVVMLFEVICRCEVTDNPPSMQRHTHTTSHAVQRHTHTHTGHWSSVTSWGDLFQLPDQQQWDQRCVYLDESAEYKAPGSLLTAPCRIGGILLRIKSSQTRRNTLWRFHTRLKRPHQLLKGNSAASSCLLSKGKCLILVTFCIRLWLLWMDFFFQWFLLLVPKEDSRLNKYLFGV